MEGGWVENGGRRADGLEALYHPLEPFAVSGIQLDRRHGLGVAEDLAVLQARGSSLDSCVNEPEIRSEVTTAPIKAVKAWR
jgi:hypothetical protein